METEAGKERQLRKGMRIESEQERKTETEEIVIWKRKWDGKYGRI